MWTFAVLIENFSYAIMIKNGRITSGFCLEPITRTMMGFFGKLYQNQTKSYLVCNCMYEQLQNVALDLLHAKSYFSKLLYRSKIHNGTIQKVSHIKQLTNYLYSKGRVLLQKREVGFDSDNFLFAYQSPVFDLVSQKCNC